MEKDTSRTIARQAARFFSGTMISRITGLLRDMTMAACFGATPFVAAFMIAFRFTNLLRRLLGEGAMQSAFIPQFEALRREDPYKASLFFRDLSLLVSLFLVGFVLLTEAGCALWLSLAPPSPDWQDVIILTMLSLPSLVFICLYGLYSSLLQCEKRFFLPSVAPVFFNIVWMGAAFSLRDLPPMKAMQGLALSLIVAYAVQWMVISRSVMIYLRQHLSLGMIWLKIRLEGKLLKRLIKPLFFAILGVGAAQINSNLDPLFARGADLQGPVYLWYAIRLQQLPLALFGIGIASALLPSLSRARDQGDVERYRSLLSGAVNKTALLMIPLTGLMIALGGSSLNFLFGHGDFTSEAISQTTWCLWGYLCGLLPMTLVLLFATAFYSQQSFSAPLKASLVSMMANIALNSLFVFVLEGGAASIAFATSIAAFINFFMLAAALKEKGLTPERGGAHKEIGIVTFATILAVVTTFIVGSKWLDDPSASLFLLNKKAVYNHGLFNQLFTLTLEGLTFLGTGGLVSLLSLYALRSRKSSVS